MMIGSTQRMRLVGWPPVRSEGDNECIIGQED